MAPLCNINGNTLTSAQYCFTANNQVLSVNAVFYVTVVYVT